MSDPNDHDDDARQWWETQHKTIVPHVVPGEILKMRHRATSPEPNSMRTDGLSLFDQCPSNAQTRRWW